MKSNGTYFFVVETENFVGTASLFEENLKRTFPSAEFMRGYAEGYFEDYLHLGETAFDVRFYGANPRIDVADYEDGIVRLIAYVGSVDVGRMLVGRTDFINNVKFLMKKGIQNG